MQQLDGEKMLYKLQYDLSNNIKGTPTKMKFDSYEVRNIERIDIKIVDNGLPFEEIDLYGSRGYALVEYLPIITQRIYSMRKYQYSYDDECIYIRQLKSSGGKKRTLSSEEINVAIKCLKEGVMDLEEISDAFNISVKYIEEVTKKYSRETISCNQ